MSDAVLVLTLGLTLLAGGVLGVLGGGGSILSVPILLYVAQLPTDQAIATSLLVVGTTSALGALLRAGRGEVQVRLGLTMGAAGMVGAVLGARLGAHLPAVLLVDGFIAVMAVAGVSMLRARRDASAPRRSPAFGAALGVAIGALTGLVGAGGGFLTVPALALVAALPMTEAVATSMMITALQASAALAGKLDHVALDATLCVELTAAAVIGMGLGTWVARHLAPSQLRRGFGGFLVLAAAGMAAHLLATGGVK